MLLRIFSLYYVFLCIDAIIISTKYGKLMGYQYIPFAAPPVGNLRFALPQPPSPWKGIRNATEFGPACLSNSTESSSIQKWMDEDCLHMNIYAGNDCLKTSCSVVFYIHGGNNNYDSAVMFKDGSLVENFASKGIVLVISAFRLGLFGVLTFDNDNVVPSNIAEHDKIAGLNWVQDNIASFGGNPQDVTIFGHSGGGASAVMLGFSKSVNLKRRLFHKIVAMSPVVIFTNILHLSGITNQLISLSKCSPYGTLPIVPTENYVKEAVRCLRKLPATELLRIQRSMEENGLKASGTVMTDALFPAKSFHDFIENPPAIPLLIGSLSKEFRYKKHPVFELFICSGLDMQNPIACGEKYLHDEENKQLKFDHGLDTQMLFTLLLMTAQSMRKTGAPVYLYSYRNPLHPYHADDLFYLTGVHAFDMDPNEKVLSKLYPKYFQNFIKTGIPDKSWDRLGFTNNYFYIDVNLTTGLRPHNAYSYENETISYWNGEMREFDWKLTKMREAEDEFSSRAKAHLLPTVLNSESITSTTSENVVILLLYIFAAVSLFYWLSQFLKHRSQSYYSYVYDTNVELAEKIPLK